jgi:hypothetical protein
MQLRFPELPLDSMPDVAWNIDRDFIHLEQESSNPDYGVDAISIHVAQLRLIAERAGLLDPVPRMTAAPDYTPFMNRLRWIIAELEEMREPMHLDDIIKRAPYGLEFAQRLMTVHEHVEMLLDDCERNENTCNANTVSYIVTEPLPVSVTRNENSKPGRPATGQAMTNAERQKAHRERQAADRQQQERAIVQGAPA